MASGEYTGCCEVCYQPRESCLAVWMSPKGKAGCTHPGAPISMCARCRNALAGKFTLAETPQKDGPRQPPGWEQVFMRIAHEIAERSKNPGTRVGAVLVGERNEQISTGFNGPPRGCPDHRLPWRSPDNLGWHVHAEDNALWFGAMSRGWVGLDRCKLFVTHRPCARCALMIVRAGLSRVVIGDAVTSQSTDDDWSQAMEIMNVGGVQCRTLTD